MNERLRCFFQTIRTKTVILSLSTGKPAGRSDWNLPLVDYILDTWASGKVSTPAHAPLTLHSPVQGKTIQNKADAIDVGSQIP